MRRHLAPLALTLLPILLALSACADVPDSQTPSPGPTPSPTHIEMPDLSVPEVGDRPAAISSPAPNPTSAPTPMIVPVATPTFAPEQNPLSLEEIWVRDRMSAALSLYDIAPEGGGALRSLDVRWMRDQPGFFGSHGYKSWTGVGEAKPIGVIHELSHSYWGLFPVTGFPALSWDAPRGKDLSPAMERYHQDVLEFMAQPPDHYELLRSRLRSLPQLSSSNTGPLFHTIEADTIYTTAGDLGLIPPILRKYWDPLLQPGSFHSWYEAFRWYQSLSAQQKRLADKYIGFEHFDLRSYGSLKTSEPLILNQGVEETLFQEERQRLRDFVEVFDLLLGKSEDKADFKFWRRYLQDKIELHKRHPELLASLNLPRSGQMATAMDFLKNIEDEGADKKAALIIQWVQVQPFLVHFLPAMDNFTLLKLFTSEAGLPEGATLKGTAAFVESLKRFTPHIGKVLEAGRKNVSEGADELTSFLNKVDFKEKKDLDLFFEVLQGSDNAIAKGVVAALDDSMLRRLLVPVPTKLWVLLTPARFLEFLDITLDSSPKELAQGIEDMMAYPSGNFRIDEPILDEMYRVVAARGRMAPLETLNAIAITVFPMERFISLHPAAVVDILSSDLGITAEMVRLSDPVIFPPARFVYRLIYADPEFAARVVERLDELFAHAGAVEALAHLAYDADRLQAVFGLPISLERDGRFLKRLLEDKGIEWLEGRIGEAASLYRQHVEMNEAPRDFLAAYERTLRAAASRLEDREAGHALEEMIGRIFRADEET